MEREFSGEAYPADVTEKKFDDVVCARIEGTEEEIRLTTELYVARYPITEFATEAWGDARIIARAFATEENEVTPVVRDIFELLVFRRHEP